MTAAAAPAPPKTLPATAPATASEESMGSLARFDQIKTIVVSGDLSHLAFLGIRGKTQQVVIDGVAGPAFEWVMPDSIQLMEGGKHSAYLVQTPTQTMAVVDGKAEQGYYAIGFNRVFLSPGGSHHAYSAVLSEKGPATLVVDGKAGATYDTVDWPLFSLDGSRLAFRAGADHQQFIVLDGKPLKRYDHIPDVNQVFSPDGKHLAYGGDAAGKHYIVLDEKESQPFDAVRLGPAFNIAGTVLTAVVDLKGSTQVWANEQLGEGYDAVIAGNICFSPDGKHLAYAARRENKQFIVRDGKAQAVAGTLGSGTLHFSPDSSALVYQTAVNDKHWIVADHGKFDAYDHILVGTPLFSPDSKRIACSSQRGSLWCVVVDGVAGDSFDSVDIPLFSPDSKRVANRAIRNQEGMALLDGKVIGRFDAIGPVVFSPDSKHLVYLGRHGEFTHLVIDATDTGLTYDAHLPTDRVVFDSVDTFHFIALRHSEFIRVTGHLRR